MRTLDQIRKDIDDLINGLQLDFRLYNAVKDVASQETIESIFDTIEQRNNMLDVYFKELKLTIKTLSNGN